MAKSKRGVALFEMLVTTMLMVIVGGVVVSIFGGLGSAWGSITGMNPTLAENRRSMDALAEHFRNAQVCKNASNGVLNSAISAASATSFTYYSDVNTCATVRYYLSNGNLLRNVNGVNTVVARDVVSLSMTYYKTSTYHGAWTPTTNSSAPTAAELPLIGGVQIQLASRINNQTVTSRIMVRLRNSPRKNRLEGT